nr:molybdate ABC transporter substrate-binding protein [uncultured Caproiciproducens sp.]
MKKRSKSLLAILTAAALSLSMFAGCASASAASSQPSSTAAGTVATASEAVSSQPKETTELFISAAASLTDVLKELSTAYSAKEPDVKLTFTFGASGALQTQIEEGAPSDIFLSAAQKQMDALDKKSLLLDGTRKDLLINKVTLITPKGSTKGIKSFDDVNTDKVKKIALGEPKSVPVGQYSEEIFTYLKCLDAVKKKAVYGSDVRQVLTWVESGDVDCGIVYATDAATSDKIQVAAEAPSGSHNPVVYPAAVLKSSKNADAAKAFLAFLSSDEAKALFVKYGFQMSE